MNLDELPDLSFEVLSRPQDLRDGMRLVADSVAQQRQSSSSVLVFHPACLAALAGALAITHALGTAYGAHDLGTRISIHAGVVLTYLLVIRYFTGGYVLLAEETDWVAWLRRADGKGDDVVIGARFGGEIIGALVLHLEEGTSAPLFKHHTEGKATIRAWTTRTKYRRRGLGSDMLREAVQLARKKLGDDAVIEFADDHVNSTMLLHPIFNAHFKVTDNKARRALLGAATVGDVNSEQST
jgi:ribosomal protein S18 acetylase RimI-like enzyme